MKGMEGSGGRVRTENEAGDRREKYATHAHGACEAHMRFVLKYHAGALHLAKPTVLQFSICFSRYFFSKRQEHEFIDKLQQSWKKQASTVLNARTQAAL